MIKHKLYVSLFTLVAAFISCSKIDNALDTPDMEYLSVDITTTSLVDGIADPEGLKVVFENFTEGVRIERPLTHGVTRIDSIIPGTYSINVSGIQEVDGKNYLLNGSKINQLLIDHGQQIDIAVSGATVGPLAFSEVFYAGTSPFYFRNQFYEITNNSDETVYLDGLYFANLTPGTATTTLPIWPESDDGKYVYAERIWRIPGSGSDYPLEPGASFSIAQFAANHQLPQYSPDSPIDCSSSEFEFNMDNANFPDQPATDMEHVFYNGFASKGTLPQYLTAVFGGAYVIFTVPEGEAYDPANDPTLKTRNLGTTSPSLYAKIPIEYVVDAVEAGHNENMIAAKRVASVLDAGMTYVGATYNSKGVRRKKIGERPDGSPILQDTNNSSEDFERLVTPTFRHFGQHIPTWSSAN